MKVVNISAKLIEELRRENCCGRLTELWKMFEETRDVRWLLLYYENKRRGSR